MADPTEELLDDLEIEKKKKLKNRPVRKLTLKQYDMDDAIIKDAVEFAQEGLDENKLHKDIAVMVIL